MSLLYVEGFETSRDDSDVRVRGWQAGFTKQQVALKPSVTALAGISLVAPLGPGSAATTQTGVSSTDPGYLCTNVTVNQAWLAGGFVMGFGAKFNSNTTQNFGSTILGNPNGICFDGTNYWAIQYNGTAYAIVYSPDLKNWTVSPNQPAMTMTSATTLSYIGNNVIVAIGNATSSTAMVAYYSSSTATPGSITWTAQTLGTTSTAGAPWGVAAATGNATYPHVVIIGANATSVTTGSGIYVGTIGGTMTLVSAATITYLGNHCPIRVIGNNIYVTWYNTNTATNFVVSAVAASGSLNTAGAWTQATCSTGIGIVGDIAYNPTSNQFALATTTGVWTFANSGVAGTPAILSGTLTATQRWATVQAQNIYWSAAQSLLVMWGAQGYISTSPDGYTWTNTNHILPTGTVGTDWRSVIWTGSQYVMCSDQSTGLVATSTDGVNNFACQYVQDGTEAGQATTGYGYPGFITGTQPATTGIVTTVNTGIFLYSASASGGARATNLKQAATVIGTAQNVSTASLFHYYEIVATSVPGTSNSFNLSLYVDGALLSTGGTTAYALGASTSDTTSLITMVLGRTGTFTCYDDMYFLLTNGAGYSGMLGPINIVARRPTSDTSDSWVKSGSAATNSLSTNAPALSSTPNNYVSSQNAGDKDTYTSGDTIPANYAVKAVSLEGHFNRLSTSIPTVNLGLNSGGTEVDTQNFQVTGTTPQFLSKVYENDPNGNIAWTNTSVQNAAMVLNHVV